MSTNNAANQIFTNNADGFALGGGTTARTFTFTGGDATITASGSATVTFPTSTSTLATLALAEEFTNKTLTSSVGKGTWTASGTWTLPAVTAGGLITVNAGITAAITTVGIVATVTGANTTVPLTVQMDSSSASQNALLVKNLTNFAHSGDLVKFVLSNSSDSGKGLIISNKGSGVNLSIDDGTNVTYTLTKGGKITQYNNVTTTGWGHPAIYGTGRSAGAVAAVASVAAYTVGAADGSFIVSANVLVTTATVHSFTATVTYTDEGNTSRTVTMQFSTLAGAFVTAMTNAQGTVPYGGVPLHIRCKASTSITIATTGTFTTVVYNVEGNIMQIA